jgi:ABC-type Fe3+-citrate transport system substrate-binding protein
MRALTLFMLIFVLLVAGCASNNQQSYKPKYKKVDHDKPLPCPLKDC